MAVPKEEHADAWPNSAPVGQTESPILRANHVIES